MNDYCGEKTWATCNLPATHAVIEVLGVILERTMTKEEFDKLLDQKVSRDHTCLNFLNE